MHHGPSPALCRSAPLLPYLCAAIINDIICTYDTLHYYGIQELVALPYSDLFHALLLPHLTSPYRL